MVTAFAKEARVKSSQFTAAARLGRWVPGSLLEAAVVRLVDLLGGLSLFQEAWAQNLTVSLKEALQLDC